MSGNKAGLEISVTTTPRKATETPTAKTPGTARKKAGSKSKSCLASSEAAIAAHVKLLAVAAIYSETADAILPLGYAPLRSRARGLGLQSCADHHLMLALVFSLSPPQKRIANCCAAIRRSIELHVCTPSMMTLSVAHRFGRDGTHMQQPVWFALLALCDGVVENSSFSSRKTLAEALIAAISQMPPNPSESQTKMIDSALSVLDCLPLLPSISLPPSSSPVSRSKSPVTSTFDLRNASAPPGLHWSLRPLLQRHRCRLANLDILQAQSASNTVSPSYVLEPRAVIPTAIAVTAPKTAAAKAPSLNSSALQFAQWRFYCMITERAPMTVFHEALLGVGSDKTQTIDQTKKRSLCAAVVMRVLTLLVAAKRRPQSGSAGREPATARGNSQTPFPGTSQTPVPNTLTPMPNSVSGFEPTSAPTPSVTTTTLQTPSSMLTPSVLQSSLPSSSGTPMSGPPSVTTPMTMPLEEQAATVADASMNERASVAYSHEWGEWNVLADQFHSLVLAGLVDFGQFMLLLAQCGHSYFQGRQLKDNLLIWLITQVMPLEVVKKTIQTDLQTKNGRMSKSLFSFYEPAQRCRSGVHEIRDAAIACLLWRVRSLQKDFRPPDTITKVENMHELYGSWWTETGKPENFLDFYSLSESSIVNLGVLSNISSQAVADRIVKFMNDDASDSEFVMGWQTLPGQLVFTGRTKPLPFSLLMNLSTQTRTRLAGDIKTRLYDTSAQDATSTSSRITPPGLVETYTRLLHIAPYALGPHIDQIQKHLTSSEHSFCLHTLVEMINFRLFRLFHHRRSLPALFSDVSALAAVVKHPQLSESVENLLLKIALCTPIDFRGRLVGSADLGAPINRALLYGLARAITSDQSLSVDDAYLDAFVNYYQGTRPRPLAASILKYLPEPLKKRLHASSTASAPSYPTFDKATADASRADFLSLLEFSPSHEDIDRILQGDAIARRDILCALAVLYLKQKTAFIEYEYNLQSVIQNLGHRDQTAATYALADFLVAAVAGGRLESVAVASELVVQFVWGTRIVMLDAMVLALVEHDDELMFPVLSALLLHEEFRKRIELLPQRRFEMDEDFLASHIEYHTSFHEVSVYDRNQATDDDAVLPVYYGNLCSRMVPVLDIVLARGIECGHAEFLVQLATCFRKLYEVYHSARVSLVRHLFTHYDGSEVLTPAVKHALLRLCVDETASEPSMFSPALRRYVEADAHAQGQDCDGSVHMSNDDEMDVRGFNHEDNAVFTSHSYLLGLVSSIASHLTLLQDPGATSDHTAQFFFEFCSTLDETLNCVIVEMLSLPLSVDTLVSSLLEALMAGPLPSSVSVQKFMLAFGILLRSLPRRFLEAAIDSFAASVLRQSKSVSAPLNSPSLPAKLSQRLKELEMQSPSSLTPFALSSDSQSTTRALLQNGHAHLITALFSVMDRADPKLFGRFVCKLYEAVHTQQPIELPKQLYFIVRSFAPYLLTKGPASGAIDQACLLIFEGLQQLCRFLGLHLSQCSVPKPEDVPGWCAIETVCNFVCTCLQQCKSDLSARAFGELLARRATIPPPINTLLVQP